MKFLSGIMFLLLSHLFIIKCGPTKSATSDSNHNGRTATQSGSYRVLILPQYTRINDGLINKNCIQGEINGQKMTFLHGIEGFEYQEGYQYEIEIAEEDIPVVPADYGENKKYILKKVISKSKPKDQSFTKIDINSDFNKDSTNMDSYRYIFSITDDGNGFAARVMTYESAEQWINDTKQKLNISKNKKGHDYIIRKMTNEFKSKVDFSKENLIILYMHTGGPPYGELKHQWKGNTCEFFIEEPKSHLRGMALRTFYEFYKTNKPNQAVLRK